MMIEPITKAEILASWNDAERKLECIIEREGDANGERREPEYFIQILRECILAKREAESFLDKAKGHQALARCPIHGNFSRLTLPASPTFFDL